MRGLRVSVPVDCVFSPRKLNIRLMSGLCFQVVILEQDAHTVSQISNPSFILMMRNLIQVLLRLTCLETWVHINVSWPRRGCGMYSAHIAFQPKAVGCSKFLGGWLGQAQHHFGWNGCSSNRTSRQDKVALWGRIWAFDLADLVNDGGERQSGPVSAVFFIM